jgi:hypothetical protein
MNTRKLACFCAAATPPVALLTAALLGASGAAAQGTESNATSAPPAGATGICKDGQYVYVAERKGACKGRGGLQEWFASAHFKRETDEAAIAASQIAAPAAAAPVDEDLKQQLFAANGFDVRWVCGNQRGGSKVLFREDGEKVVAEVDNLSRGSCKGQGRFTADGFSWDACNDSGIKMVFDASNKDMPFKASTMNCTYQFKRR